MVAISNTFGHKHNGSKIRYHFYSNLYFNYFFMAERHFYLKPKGPFSSEMGLKHKCKHKAKVKVGVANQQW